MTKDFISLMSLKRNIFANYVGQSYVALISIVMIPQYILYMGVEAYGLVGFFAMLQAWFQLLDMGLTHTITRETARFSGGADDAIDLRRLLRALEGIFIGVALVGCVGMIAGATTIARHWLNVQQLPIDEVQHAIMLMAVVVAVRWICGLYRGAISGFEHLVWLNSFNIAIATAHFVLVIPFFIFVGTRPTDFFFYQVAVSVVEIVMLVTKTYSLLPNVGSGERLLWQWQPLRGVLKFSASIAFTSLVWVLVTQTDKLLLSKLLPLTEYAYFTLAVIVASGVIVISSPVSGALLPRMTKLNAGNDEAGLIRLYCDAAQLVGIIAIPAALVLAFFPEQVLWVWTGDADIARKASSILTMYALGNGILALSAFPFYLQYAKGDLKLHIIGNALFAVLLIPALIWAVWKYGVTGAGYAWMWSNMACFLLWVPWVHKKLVRGLHVKWLYDVAKVLLVSLGTLMISSALLNSSIGWPQTRLPVAILLAALWTLQSSIAAMASASVREKIADAWQAWSWKK
jgi:O-antigen/teichoic acid export membrane protein